MANEMEVELDASNVLKLVCLPEDISCSGHLDCSFLFGRPHHASSWTTCLADSSPQCNITQLTGINLNKILDDYLTTHDDFSMVSTVDSVCSADCSLVAVLAVILGSDDNKTSHWTIMLCLYIRDIGTFKLFFVRKGPAVDNGLWKKLPIASLEPTRRIFCSHPYWIRFCSEPLLYQRGRSTGESNKLALWSKGMKLHQILPKASRARPYSALEVSESAFIKLSLPPHESDAHSDKVRKLYRVRSVTSGGRSGMRFHFLPKDADQNDSEAWKCVDPDHNIQLVCAMSDQMDTICPDRLAKALQSMDAQLENLGLTDERHRYRGALANKFFETLSWRLDNPHPVTALSMHNVSQCAADIDQVVHIDLCCCDFTVLIYACE